MSNPTEPTGPSLEDSINDVLTKMKSYDPHSEEYAKLVERLTELYAIKSTQAPDRFSKDQILAAAGNLLGIIMILNFERTALASSKAFSFVMKSRV